MKWQLLEEESSSRRAHPRQPLAEGCLAQLTGPPCDYSFSPLRQEWPPTSTFHKSPHFTQLSLRATEEPGHESIKSLENFKEDRAQIWVQNMFSLKENIE